MPFHPYFAPRIMKNVVLFMSLPICTTVTQTEPEQPPKTANSQLDSSLLGLTIWIFLSAVS